MARQGNEVLSKDYRLVLFLKKNSGSSFSSNGEYCVLFSERAVNFIPTVRRCFQNRIFSYNLSLLTILAIVTVVSAVFIGHRHYCAYMHTVHFILYGV